jgi:predicted TIM-barrel fold metal-dependent hydrolase
MEAKVNQEVRPDVQSGAEASERAVIISSDGHATARMDDYRDYLDPQYRDEFADFCKLYKLEGSRNFDRASLLNRCDPDVVDQWVHDVVESGRADGEWDPAKRLVELSREGVVAEVLFPDFGLPFELYPPLLAEVKGYPPRSQDKVDAANRAYNRWLANFCATAPERFAGMVVVGFHDVDAAVAEIRRGKEAGLRAVLLPYFEATQPIFDPRYEPIWNTCVELGMPVNSHVGMSSATDYRMPLAEFPHPATAGPIIGSQMNFFCHELLGQLIWGGVLERHPELQVVFTEQGSGWVIGAISGFDYSYEGSYLRRDIREVVRRKPSEYWTRQCHLGSSLLTRDEVRARHLIGVDKMMFGVDYPHHEGTFGGGTRNYLRATFGAASVSVAEARQMLGGNAAQLFGFDLDALGQIAAEVGPVFAEILTPPTEEKFPRGDVNKPMSSAFSMP